MDSFPRKGGKKLGIKKSADAKKIKSKSHEKTNKKNINAGVEKTNLIPTTADRLSMTLIQEGLILLGRVFKVLKYELKVCLPGGSRGCVEATDISQSYTNLLQDIKAKVIHSSEYKLLSDLYKPGDYVTCYVKLSTYNAEDKWNCSLSMEPQLINQNFGINYLVEGTEMVCTVKSIEDYGYIVDTGIPKVARAYIAIEYVDKGKQYFPGTQLLCTIKEIETDPLSIKLSAKRKEINNANAHDIVSLDVLTPGIKLPLCITKILTNGLQVMFGKDNVGYINRIHLNNPLSTYVENTKVIGTLLYILPTVKLAYFTLLTDTLEKETLYVGDIIEKAKVLYREGGIIFKLSESGLRGYLSLRRINVPFEKIPSQFKKGFTRKCRILSYHWMEHFYSCTIEEEILKEKYFCTSELNIGDILTVTVTRIETSRKYIIVQVGRIWGIVLSHHISDSGSSALHKLKVGDNVKARVLDKDDDENRIKFTLKQSLIKSKLPVLYDFDQAKCELKYHGTIDKIINKNDLLVKFYGTVKGLVPHPKLNKKTRNMQQNFTVGQTVTVCVTSVEEDEYGIKLKIVTENPQQPFSSSLLIGEMVEGTVTESSIKGIYLKIQKEDDEDVVTGFLPAGHMAPCIEVGSLLASRCVPGDVIWARVFATKPTVILLRTFVTQEEYRTFDSLKIGDCIPCTVQDILQEGVKVVLPIENYSKLGFVSYKDISNFELLYTNQILFVKITAINEQEKLLSLTMLLNELWQGSSEHELKLMSAVDILSLYFNKLLELARSTFYEKKPISSANLGQKVIGTVKKITEQGLVLQLNNQLMGTVHKDHYVGSPRVGDKVHGTILWKNYVHELVDVSLLPKIVNSISSEQKTLRELPTGVKLTGEILMITKWLILVVVKRNGIGYLAALPVRRNINDISPDLTSYKVHTKIQLYVVLKRNETGIVPICMLKSPIKTPKEKIVTELSTTKNKELEKKEFGAESLNDEFQEDVRSNATSEEDENPLP